MQRDFASTYDQSKLSTYSSAPRAAITSAKDDRHRPANPSVFQPRNFHARRVQFLCCIQPFCLTSSSTLLDKWLSVTRKDVKNQEEEGWSTEEPLLLALGVPTAKPDGGSPLLVNRVDGAGTGERARDVSGRERRL